MVACTVVALWIECLWDCSFLARNSHMWCFKKKILAYVVFFPKKGIFCRNLAELCPYAFQ